MLVHCHAGRSRSCSLVLAWLMTRRRWPLNRALAFLQRMRPEAAPNAGYLAALLSLEEELFGRQTVKVRLSGIWCFTSVSVLRGGWGVRLTVPGGGAVWEADGQGVRE